MPAPRGGRHIATPRRARGIAPRMRALFVCALALACARAAAAGAIDGARDAARGAASARAAPTRRALDLTRHRSPLALVHGAVTIEGASSVSDEGGACCVVVTCEAGGETHASRLCGEGGGNAAPIGGARGGRANRSIEREGAANEATVARHFGFGIGRSIVGERVVVRATMERGCAARSRRTGAIETGAIEDAATAIEDAHFVDFPVVFASADGGGRSVAVVGDGEFVLALASVVALALVNAALKALRGSRFAREVANDDAPASAESVPWQELVGEMNALKVKQIVREQRERAAHLAPTAEWTVTAKSPALDYFAPRTNTRDLVFDFLTSHPFSIAPKHANREWDSDADSCDDNDAVPWLSTHGLETSDVDSAMEYDLFGTAFHPGTDFSMTIRGHGPAPVARKVMSDIASCRHFTDMDLKFFEDQHEE